MIIDCQESGQRQYKNCWWLGPYIPNTPSDKPFPGGQDTAAFGAADCSGVPKDGEAVTRRKLRAGTLADLLSRAMPIPFSGCWIWLDTLAHGYGSLTVHSERKLAHRYAKELALGRTLRTEEFVCHRCDIPACINPEHLFVATRRENIHDCISKGRKTAPPVHRGEAQHSHKLTEADVLRIRALYGTRRGVLMQMAREYGVDRHTIRAAALGRTWAWLVPPKDS